MKLEMNLKSKSTTKWAINVVITSDKYRLSLQLNLSLSVPHAVSRNPKWEYYPAKLQRKVIIQNGFAAIELPELQLQLLAESKSGES